MRALVALLALLLAAPGAAQITCLGGGCGGAAGGSGDVVGPAASVDNALVRFDGTTGKLIQGYTSGAPTCGDTGTCAFTSVTLASTGAGTPNYFTVPALTLMTGANNFVLGAGAGAALTSGVQNTVIGTNAGDGFTTVNDNTFFGFNAGTGVTMGAGNTAVGSGALDATTTTAAVQNTAVGFTALGGISTGTQNTCVGANCMRSATTGSGNVCVGYFCGADAITTGSNNTVIGSNSTFASNVSDGICIGNTCQVPAANEMAIGGAAHQITAVYIGEGATNASPLSVTIHATGGSGSDIAGANITIAGGKGTGAGAGGSVVLSTSDILGTGTTLQTLVPRLTIDRSGHLVSGGTAPAITSCDTSPSVVTGNDISGEFTWGTGSVDASCTLTFATAYATKPQCFANNEDTLIVLRAVTTTTTLVIDAALAASVDGDKITYFCIE